MSGDRGFTPEEQTAIEAAIAAGKCRRVEYRSLLPSKENGKFDRAFYLKRHKFLTSKGIDSLTAPTEIVALCLNDACKRTAKGSFYTHQNAALLQGNIKRALDERC